MLKNITIKTRLIFVTAFLSLQLIIGAVIGITGLGFANDSIKTIYDDRLIATSQLDVVIRLLTLNQQLIAEAITAEPAQAASMLAEMEANIQRNNKIWDEYMATFLTPQEKKLAVQFAESRKKFVAEGMMQAAAALRAQDVKKATEMVHGPLKQLFVPVRDNINALIKLQLDVAKKEYDQSQRTYQLIRNWCVAGVLFGLMLAAVTGVWLVRSISRPLQAAVRIAGSVASGDLTQRIEVNSTDETGQLMQALKDMNASLVNIVSQVSAGTDTISTASSQITAGSQDLSSRTEQQASSLEETASSMEELTSTVSQNADNAKQANQLAVSARDVAIKGGDVVAQVVTTMGAINESARRIVDIISVIDGIAFQTNILALNAAVEAARAGEQGRGFAVVATEVRNLAQRSAAAAKEIKALIGDSVEKVDAGSKLVTEAGSTMDEVVASVRRVTEIMADITAASQEQSSGIAQVNQAIAQMDQVTQQNAALVEEAAAAAESMQDQAGILSQVVGVFKLDHAMTHPQTVSAQPLRAKTKAPALSTKAPAAASRTAVAKAPARKQLTAAATPAGAEWEEF